MDVSEIWDNLVYLVIPVVALLLFLWSRRIRRRWLRILARTFSFLVFLLGGVALLLDGYSLASCTGRKPGVMSQNGRHVAVIYWVLTGATGSDHVHVSVRSRFSPVSTEVFNGSAQYPDQPKVRWLDDHRLLISYWERGAIMACSPTSSVSKDIQVLCQE